MQVRVSGAARRLPGKLCDPGAGPKSKPSAVILGLCAILAVVAVSSGGSSARAAEPEGPLDVRFEWVGSPVAPGTERELRVAFTPPDDLTGLRLTILAPPTVGVRGIDALQDALVAERALDGRDLYRLELDPSRAGVTRVLTFAVRAPGARGGVTSFVVSGVDPAGVRVRDGVGVGVGPPGPKPTVRHGAVEFRAVPRPEEDPRGEGEGGGGRP